MLIETKGLSYSPDTTIRSFENKLKETARLRNLAYTRSLSIYRNSPTTHLQNLCRSAKKSELTPSLPLCRSPESWINEDDVIEIFGFFENNEKSLSTRWFSETTTKNSYSTVSLEAKKIVYGYLQKCYPPVESDDEINRFSTQQLKSEFIQKLNDDIAIRIKNQRELRFEQVDVRDLFLAR